MELDSYVSSTVLFLSTESEHSLSSLDVSEYEHNEQLTRHGSPTSMLNNPSFFTGYSQPA